MKANAFTWIRSETFWRHFLSLVMASVFIIAGVIKLSDPSAFTQDILRYRMLSESWSTFLAACLPWLEILVGLSFFYRPLRLSASFLTVGLMTIFTVAVAVSLLRGLDISCGCFGKAFQEYVGSGLHFLLRDILLLAASCALLGLLIRMEVRIIENRVESQT